MAVSPAERGSVSAPQREVKIVAAGEIVTFEREHKSGTIIMGRHASVVIYQEVNSPPIRNHLIDTAEDFTPRENSFYSSPNTESYEPKI